tara:strand:- start:728 stop:868 length:141 start_codon:yes stop_codon:yes gene_type:complete
MNNPKLIEKLNNLDVDFEEVKPIGSIKRRFTTFNKWIEYINEQVKK